MVKGKIVERGGWHIFRKEVGVCVFVEFLESKDQAVRDVTLCLRHRPNVNSHTILSSRDSSLSFGRLLSCRQKFS